MKDIKVEKKLNWSSILKKFYPLKNKNKTQRNKSKKKTNDRDQKPTTLPRHQQSPSWEPSIRESRGCPWFSGLLGFYWLPPEYHLKMPSASSTSHISNQFLGNELHRCFWTAPNQGAPILHFSLPSVLPALRLSHYGSCLEGSRHAGAARQL